MRRARAADAALARGELWGPLHGVPVTIKDSIETAGLRTTSGFPPLADYVPAADAPVVARVRAAGGIVLGKTNLPSLAMDYQANNPIFGRTNNPWDPSRAVGGSTGGGAAALAAGLTPLEIGSDLGGSVRIPAHYCGVFALKPSEHRVPTTGHVPELPGGPRGLRHMATIGPLARSLADLELALQVIAGPDGRQWEVPPVPLTRASSRPLRDLRLAWTDDFGGIPVTRDTRAALAGLTEELARRGCRVERQVPEGFDATAAWETWGELAQSEIGSGMTAEAEAEMAASFSVSVDSPVALSRGLARGLNATLRRYTAVLQQRDALIAALERFLAGWDALLCPVTVGPAIPHCASGTPVVVDDGEVPYLVGGLAYTSLFNATGGPVVVLPIGRSREGLPIGVQVVGRRWGEMELLAVAARLAEVSGPCPHPPGY